MTEQTTRRNFLKKSLVGLVSAATIGLTTLSGCRDLGPHCSCHGKPYETTESKPLKIETSAFEPVHLSRPYSRGNNTRVHYDVSMAYTTLTFDVNGSIETATRQVTEDEARKLESIIQSAIENNDEINIDICEGTSNRHIDHARYKGCTMHFGRSRYPTLWCPEEK